MDNLDKLLEAIDQPEKYTEQDLRAMLSDHDTRELYNLLISYRASDLASNDFLTGQNIECEWQKFLADNSDLIPAQEGKTVNKTNWLHRLFSRKIAAVLIFVVASCSVIAVGVSLGIRSKILNHEDITSLDFAATDTLLSKRDAEISSGLPLDTVIIFENKPLDAILSELAPIYGVEVALSAPISKEVRLFFRWDSSMSLPELIEHLNTFERINLTLSNNTISD